MHRNIDELIKLFGAAIKNNTSNDEKTFSENTTAEILKRDEQYSRLLEHFVKVTKVRNIIKEIFKWIFFCIVIGSLIAFIVIVFQLFNKILNNSSMQEITTLLPLVTSAIIGFSSAVIAVPITIAKYLFSTKEDDNITSIISHTQDHDIHGRKWITDSQNSESKNSSKEKEVS